MRTVLFFTATVKERKSHSKILRKKTYGVLLDDIKVMGLSIGDSPEYQEGANIEKIEERTTSILSLKMKTLTVTSVFLSLA